MCIKRLIIAHIKRVVLCVYLLHCLAVCHCRSLQEHQECEKFFVANDCYYFPCLDSHYTCGPDNHLVGFTHNFCQLTSKKYAPQLNNDAQLYFNHTSKCAMTALHDQLVEGSISARFTCAHLQLMIVRIYAKCLHNEQPERKMVSVVDFCSIVCDNLETMINLFLNLNDGHVNLQELLLETGRNCGAEILPSTTRTVPALLVAICLDRKTVRLKNDITKIMFGSRFEFNDYDWGWSIKT